MIRQTNPWLITAIAFVAIGLILFVVVMMACNWDFSKLSTAKYETNTYDLKDPFTGIAMETDTADIRFTLSDDGTCKVVCYEPENARHSVAVQDGLLTIKHSDQRKWYEHLDITSVTSRITVYLPEAEYGTLSITERTGDIELEKDFRFDSIDVSASTGDVTCYASADTVNIATSTGHIWAGNISADSLEISVTTGKVTVSDVICSGDITVNVSTGRTAMTNITCRSLRSGGDTGNITLTNVVAAGTFNIERSTGDVTFDRCDADEIFVITDTGDVRGSLLSE